MNAKVSKLLGEVRKSIEEAEPGMDPEAEAGDVEVDMDDLVRGFVLAMKPYIDADDPRQQLVMAIQLMKQVIREKATLARALKFMGRAGGAAKQMRSLRKTV